MSDGKETGLPRKDLPEGWVDAIGDFPEEFKPPKANRIPPPSEPEDGRAFTRGHIYYDPNSRSASATS